MEMDKKMRDLGKLEVETIKKMVEEKGTVYVLEVYSDEIFPEGETHGQNFTVAPDVSDVAYVLTATFGVIDALYDKDVSDLDNMSKQTEEVIKRIDEKGVFKKVNENKIEVEGGVKMVTAYVAVFDKESIKSLDE